MPIYPFNGRASGNPRQGYLFDIHEKLSKKQRLTPQEEFLLMSNIEHPTCVPKGCAASAGWCYDFRPFLNLYWVRMYHSDIYQMYAPSKRAIREHHRGSRQFPGPHIGRIVLVEKRGKKAHE